MDIQRCIYIFLIASSFYVQAFAADHHQCGRQACKGIAKKFAYEEGHVYKYNYEFETKTTVQGTSPQETNLSLLAEISVYFHSLCDLTLEVNSAVFSSAVSDGSTNPDAQKHEELASLLTQHPLRIGFYDGHIREICPSAGESDWGLNVKRGLVSMFQNTMHRLDLSHFDIETDVTGTCPVHYDFQFSSGQGSSVTVTKTKDLNSCSDRSYRQTALYGVPYNFPRSSDFPPLVNSSSHCTQQIDQKRLVSAECHETHLLSPFSYESQGIVTTSVQKLTFVEGENTEMSPKPFESRRSLNFEHKPVTKSPFISEANTLRALESLRDSTSQAVSFEASQHFTELVEQIKGLTYPEISKLLGKIDGHNQNKQALRWFWQGLIASGTSASMAALRDEAVSGSLPHDMTEAWQRSFAFLSAPTRDHLLAALPLLDLSATVRPPKIALSLSNLAHALCQRTACDDIEEIGMLVKKIGSPLSSNCQVSTNEEADVLSALKSIGNIGHQLQEILPNVEACFINPAVPTSLRIAALQSLRNAPCSISRQKWWDVFSDVNLDSELRIQAYLGVTKCADYSIVRNVVSLLRNEPVKQVASFVYSHLRSTQKSSLPGKQNLQSLVADMDLETKFGNMNFTMYSGHYETSFHVDRLNTGAGVESQLIFSRESFIPRSALVSLTVDFFGRSLNLFEVSSRAEGVETVLGKLFGPEGSYKDATVAEIVRTLRPKRRARKDDVDASKVKAIDSMFKKNSPMSTSKMDLAVKILGNELYNMEWTGDKMLEDAARSFSPMSFFTNGLKKEGSQLNGAKQFLDSAYVLPISVGLPLRLAAKGNALVDWDGSVDGQDMASVLRTGEGIFRWKFQPSASVQIEGSMAIETPVAVNGITLNLTLHSSVSAEGSVTVNGYRLIDVLFQMPRDKLEILNAKSNLILKHNEAKIAIKGIQDNHKSHKSCIKGALETVLGLQLCSEWAFSNASQLNEAPWFPLTGPAQFHLSVLKTNNLVTGYRFLHKLENSKAVKSWALLVESQGSESKGFGVKTHLNIETGQGLLAFTLPSATYELKGVYKYEDYLKELEAGFYIGKRKIVGAGLHVKKQSSGKAVVYQPRAFFVYSDKRVGNVTGEIRLVDKKGTVRYDTDLQVFFTEKLSVGTKGYYMVDDKSSTTDFLLDYQWQGGKRERVKWEMKLNNQTTDLAQNYEVHVEAELSAYPQYNVLSTWKYLQGNGRFENELKINSGHTVKNPHYQLFLLQNMSYTSGTQNERLSVQLETSLPSRQLDTMLHLAYSVDDKAVDGKFDLRYSTGREIKSGVTFVRIGPKWNNLNGSVEIATADRSILKMDGSLKSFQPSRYEVTTRGLWLGSTDFTSTAKFASAGIAPATFDYTIDFGIASSSFQEIQTASRFVFNPSRLLLNAEAKVGKNAFSVGFDYQHEDSLDHNVTVSLGYFNRMHFLTSHVNWKEGQNGQIHVHIDKVRDIHGEFGYKPQSRNRAEWFAEFKWDANRDPLQRITLKGTDVLYGENRNGTAVLTFPGHVVRSHWTLLQSSRNKTIFGNVNWGEGPIEFSGTAAVSQSGLSSSVIVNTPFLGWEKNTAVFRAERTKDESMIVFTTNWGKSGNLTLLAQGGLNSQPASWSVDGRVLVTSSWETFSKVDASWKTEIKKGAVNNFFAVQKDLVPLVQVSANSEWDLENGLAFNSSLGFESFSSHLSAIKLELRHQTHVENWISETLLETQINKQKYALNLKGRAPQEPLPRFEVVATISTPHMGYEVLGVVVDIVADEIHPVAQLQFAWPGKKISLLAKLDLKEDAYGGTLNVTTPFEAFRTGHVTVGYDSDGYKLKQKIGVAWNADNEIQLNWHSAFSHWQNFTCGGSITTSYPDHEAYGGELQLEFDPTWPVLKAQTQARWADNQIGFGVMVEKEGHISKASSHLELPQTPVTFVSMKLDQESKTVFEAIATRGDQEIRLKGTTTTEDEKDVLKLSLFTSFEALKQLDIKSQYLLKMEETPYLTLTVGVKWMDFSLTEKGGGLHVLYKNTVEEDFETFSTKSVLETAFEIKTPFSWLEDGGVVISNVMEETQITQSGLLYFRDYYVKYAGDIDLNGVAVTSLNWDKKNAKQQLLMNSTWNVGEDDSILIQGVLETPFRGYKKLPWTAKYSSTDGKSADYNYQGDQEENGEIGDYSEPTPTEENTDWSRNVAIEVKLPQNQAANLNVEFKHGELILTATSPFTALKNGDVKIMYSATDGDYTASGSGTLNGETLEISATVTPDPSGFIPAKIEANMLVPSNDLLSASLNWLRTVEESDELSSQSISGSVAWNDKLIEINARSNSNTTSFFYDVALITPFVDYESWSTSIQFSQDEEYYAHVTLKTPFPALPTLSAVSRLKWMDYVTKVVLAVDTLNLVVRGELGGEWSPEVASALCKLVLESEPNDLKHNVELSLDYKTYEEKEDRTLAIIGLWNDKFDVKLNSEWVFQHWDTYLFFIDGHAALSAAIGSYVNDEWTVRGIIDAKNPTLAYKHDVQYALKSEGQKFHTYSNYERNEDNFDGKIGTLWSGNETPVELRVNGEYQGKILQSKLEIISPWTNLPIKVDLQYDSNRPKTVSKVDLNWLGNSYFLSTDMRYQGLMNMEGSIRLTTQQEALSELVIQVDTQEIAGTLNGTYRVDWNGGNHVDAHISHKSSRKSVTLPINRDVQGLVQLTTSWSKLLPVVLKYNHKHLSPTERTSNVIFVYDEKEVLNTLYNIKEQSSAGKDKFEVNVELRNALFPIGVSYTRNFEYSGGDDGLNLPTKLHKIGSIFGLEVKNSRRLTGEYIEITTITGQDYTILVSSPSRTISLKTKYDFPENWFRHSTEFRWRPDASVAYKIDIENRTRERETEYLIMTSFFTPVRNFGILGSLLLNETVPSLRSMVAHGEAVWDLRRPDSTVKSSLQYDELPNAKRKIVLGFGQGKLPQDVIIEASYVQKKPFIADPRMVVKYTTDPSRHLTLSGSSRLQTEADGSWVLQSYFNLSHPVTNWNIRFNSTQTVESEMASSKMYLFYSRGREEKITIENIAYFDMDAPSFQIQTTTPWYKTSQSGQADLLGPVYKVDVQNQVNSSPPQKAELILNTLTPYLGAVMQYDPESVRGVHLQAVIPDKRTVSVALWHQEEEYRDFWLSSYVKLNHTRLLTSRTQWRTTLYSEGMEYWWQVWESRKEQSVVLLKEAGDRVYDETQAVLEAFLKDFNSVLKSPLQHLKEDLTSLAEDYKRLQQNVIDGYNDNAFYAKTIVDFTREFMKEIPFSTYVDKLVDWAETAANKLAAIFVSSTDAFTRWSEDFRQQVKDGYDKFVQWLKTAIESWKNRPKFITESEWKETITAVLSKYRQALEDSSRVFESAAQEYWTHFSSFCDRNMQSLVDTLRPTLLEMYNYVETTVWYTAQEMLDFLYSQNEAMVTSPYYHKLMQFKEDLDIFYEDMMNSDWTTIWNKYYAKLLDFMQIKYQESGFSSLGVGKYLESWIKKALSHPDVKDAVERLKAIEAQILWVIDYADISNRMSSGISYLWHHTEEILTQTALQAAEKHSEAKTKFTFSPAKGITELEQKLPFPWHAFDERPLFEEIPEIKSVLQIKELFQESNKTSLWENMNSLWSDVKMLSEVELNLNSLSLPRGFLPPYRGTAIISGVNHILTFDGELLHLPSPSPCTYLLSRDVVTGSYTLTMKHVTTAKGKGHSAVLTLTIDEAPWEIDVSAQTVRVAGIERVLPTEERGTVAYYVNKNIVVSSEAKGVLLVCGSSYETCVLTVSGWYFSRVAGLMGTLDNEPITDKVLPDRKPALNEKHLLDSWNISPAGVCEVPSLVPAVPSSELCRRCSSFFSSSRSVLRPCFSKVDPSPYRLICLNSGKKNGPEGCAAVAAYKEACEKERVIVPMPSNCMRCVMENGQSVPEDDSRVFKSEKNSRSSADIVFVIEAKSCNEKARSKRNLNLLVNTVDKELNAKRITKNRFAVIAFGGDSVLKGPLVRTYQGQEFVPPKDVDNLLNISTVKEPSVGSDVLSALAEAAKLKFRPGVARIVIALPCSSCDSVRSATDADSVQRTFLENDISLHVIVNHEFRFSKVKIGKLFLGMDATAGFTRKDADGPIESALVGDTALRRQVRLPKSVLGSCTTLALNTNGSIFSGARLEEGRKEHVKKMVSVLGRKVSQSAANVCQTCTCASSLSTSEAFWQCSPCIRKSLSSVDYSFLTDEISREDRMVNSKGKKGSDKKKKPKEASTEDDDVNDSDEAE